MRLGDIVDRFDDRLRTADYADVDASPNGLQVGTRGTEVERVAFAVDAAAATVEAAVEADADLLVTHHGLVWDGLDRITGREYDRFAPLFREGVGLYVAHLPLDGHQELGNAAGLADVLGLRRREPFGRLGGQVVGQRGVAPEPYGMRELGELLDEQLDTGGRAPQVLNFGPEEVREVAIVTGAGADWLDEAADAGVDAFVTGEGKGRLHHEAREAGLNVYLAGHYATETFGVQHLQALTGDWGLESTYLHHPTGL